MLRPTLKPSHGQIFSEQPEWWGKGQGASSITAFLSAGAIGQPHPPCEVDLFTG